MSYEADVHPAQMTILRHLLFVREASFGRLRQATELESDSFNFHLKQLLQNGYVTKHAPGRYGLSAKGKTYANRMDTEEALIEKQPKLSVVIIVEDHDGRQLYQERLKQPYYGYWTHPTGKIRWGETVLEAAQRELSEETGLTADLRVVGIYHKLDYDRSTGDLLEDKHFYMIHGTNPVGQLRDSEGCSNHWLTADQFLAKPRRFGDPAETKRLLGSSQPIVVEARRDYESADY